MVLVSKVRLEVVEGVTHHAYGYSVGLSEGERVLV